MVKTAHRIAELVLNASDGSLSANHRNSVAKLQPQFPRCQQIYARTIDPRDVATVNPAQRKAAEPLAIDLRLCNHDAAVDKLAVLPYPLLTLHRYLLAKLRGDSLGIGCGENHKKFVVQMQHGFGSCKGDYISLRRPMPRHHEIPVWEKFLDFADGLAERRWRRFPS